MSKTLEELELEYAALRRIRNDQYLALEALQEKITKKKTKALNLPTTPGWYLGEDKQIYRLTEYGDWDDGWGNSYFDSTFANGIETKLHRLVREDEK